MKRIPEPMLVVHVTHNEIIAFNVAILHFLKTGQRFYSTTYSDTYKLLASFQQRLVDSLSGPKQLPS